jgi:hypothetical protein
MTALVRREVNRTFSELSGFFAGLSGQYTLEAESKDFGETGNAICSRGRVHAAKRRQSCFPVQAFHVKL